MFSRLKNKINKLINSDRREYRNLIRQRQRIKHAQISRAKVSFVLSLTRVSSRENAYRIRVSNNLSNTTLTDRVYHALI